MQESSINPFGLRYLGDAHQEAVKAALTQHDYFIAVPDNKQRRQITEVLVPLLGQPVIALHKTAVLSRNIQSGEGVMIGPRVIVNSGAALGNGAVLQSGCIVEHGAQVGHYASIGAGAVVGAGAVIGDGAEVGDGAIIGKGVQVEAHSIIQPGEVVVT